MAEPDGGRTERPREETKVSRHLILKWGELAVASAERGERRRREDGDDERCADTGEQESI